MQEQTKKRICSHWTSQVKQREQPQRNQKILGRKRSKNRIRTVSVKQEISSPTAHSSAGTGTRVNQSPTDMQSDLTTAEREDIIKTIIEELFLGNHTRTEELRRHQRMYNQLNGFSDTDSEDDDRGETKKNNKVTETQPQNENITVGSAAVPILVQAAQQTDKMKTKRKTTTSAGTGAGNSHRDIHLITIGNKQSHVEHIRRRCEAVLGKTVQEAMRMTVQNNKGKKVKYKQSDLKYDVNKKFLNDK